MPCQCFVKTRLWSELNNYSELADIVAKFERYRGKIKSRKCCTVSAFSFKNSADEVLFLKAFDALSRLNSICQAAEIAPIIMRVSKAIFPIKFLFSECLRIIETVEIGRAHV